MKAAVLEALGKMVVRQVPDPKIDDDTALMKIEATAVCGSDVRIFRHGNPRVVPPTIIGHETAGTVVATGKNVTRVKKGQHIAVGADLPFDTPAEEKGIDTSERLTIPKQWARDGLGNNCEPNYAMGYQFPGAYAEYMVLPKMLLEAGPVTAIDPGKISFAEAALAEPLACAINGLELVNISPGKSVVIIGLGPIGCMMLDLARVMGATTVIGVELNPMRMDIGKTYGADAYIFPDKENVVERCLALTGGDGPDIVLTCCPVVQVHEQAIEMVAHRGYVNLFGGLPKDARPLSVLSNAIHYKECFVTGSHGSTPRQHSMAVHLLEKGLVRVGPLLTHHFSLDQVNEALETMEKCKGMKVTMYPHGPVPA